MKEMPGKWISKQKALFLLTVILLAISSISLAIHMIFGLEEAFAIGAQFFILCILLGIFATIMEFSKGRKLPYFYSILGFFLGIANFSGNEEVFTSSFIIGAGLYGYFFYRGLKFEFLIV